MKILVVKLSSLGDVVHAMPAVQDMRLAFPAAVIDWVVEPAFAPLVRRCQGIARVIACDLRRWRKAPFSQRTRTEWRAFRRELREEAYDAVIDLQGLTKSALVSRVARLVDGGKRYAIANRTDGSSYEMPTRWVADIALRVEPRIHALQRSREICAMALGFRVTAPVHFGLQAQVVQAGPAAPVPGRCVVLVHGTSRDDKGWPESHWRELGARLVADGCSLALPHGSDTERDRCGRLAAQIGPAAEVWPRLELGVLADRFASCSGVVGVDSGLSHVAVALNLPHVQIYNFPTAWRTGPPAGSARQLSVFAEPTPSVDTVWNAWRQVSRA